MSEVSISNTFYNFGNTNTNLSDASLDSILVATGSFNSIDPTRILAKRIILTGYPLKINKRSAVIRFMFFNPGENEFKIY